MKRILLLVFMSGCAGQIKELKDDNKTQYEMLGRLHNRVKALEEEQDDYWVALVQLNLMLNELQEKLNKVEYIIKEDETKCPR